MKTNTKTNALRLAETAGLFFTAYEYDISDGRIDAVSIAEKIGRPADGVFKTSTLRRMRGFISLHCEATSCPKDTSYCFSNTSF